MSLYNYCEATVQSFIWWITYSSSYDNYHVFTPTPKSLNIDLPRPDFMPVVVWMSLSIHASGKCMSLYNHCEITVQSFTWWINILTAMTIIMLLLPPPNPQILTSPNWVLCQLWPEWAYSSMLVTNSCLSITIARLRYRVPLDESHILTTTDRNPTETMKFTMDPDKEEGAAKAKWNKLGRAPW